MTVRTTEEVKADFKRKYEDSGAPSHHEFFKMLLKKYDVPEVIETPIVESEPEIQPLKPSPDEMAKYLKESFEASEEETIALMDILMQNFNIPKEEIKPEEEPEIIQPQLQPNEIVLSLSPAQMYALRETVSNEGFAEDQNEVIDQKYKNEFYSGYPNPELKPLFVRNTVLNDDMTSDEKENAIRHNMAALPINIFFLRLIQGHLSKITSVTARSLKSFIRELPENTTNSFLAKKSEDPLRPDEIVLSLTPAQLHAIRETVSREGFAEEQNEILDDLKPDNTPFFYFGNLYESEFQMLWVRNIVLDEGMTQEQKETAIRHNMTAYLTNMFLMHLIEGKISKTSVNAEALKTFIREHDQNSTLKETK